jgi:hypothetical protein
MSMWKNSRKVNKHKPKKKLLNCSFMERSIGLPAAMLLIVNSGANHSKNQTTLFI